MSNPVVIDASVAVKALVREQDSDKAAALLRSWSASGLQPVVPYLALAEVANSLHRRVVARELAGEAAAFLLNELVESIIELRDGLNLAQRAFQLASAAGLDTVYDAYYLALAEDLGCDLWTADGRFHRAIRSRFPRVKLLSSFKGN